MSRRPRRRLAALPVALAVLAVATPGSASVATATPPDAPPVLSRSLDDVAVVTDGYDGLLTRFEAARAALARAEADLVRLAREERDLAVAVARAGAVAHITAAAADLWAGRVEVLAVDAYIGAGRAEEDLAAGLDPTFTVGERQRLLTRAVDGRWRRDLAAAEAEADRARAEHRRLEEDHGAVVADAERTEAVRRDAAAEARRLGPVVLEARATATVVGSDLTLVALDAYLRAALEANADDPGCRVPWWLLAGIGRVESGHGTFAESTLDAAGTARPAIIGIALDGGNATAVITDTDGGVLDGDRRHDRAVGPMQFIPSTWTRYAADGNDDGIADPQNLYDAARAAAAYLCVAAAPLDAPANQSRAVHAYNHSQAYVDTVLGFAREYAAFRA